MKMDINGVKQVKADPDGKGVTLDDALTLAGAGRYTYMVFIICSVTLIFAVTEMFSVSILVTATQCDLGLTVSQRGLIGSIPMLGVIIGAYLWGFIADTRGRKFALVITTTGTFLSSILSSFSNCFLFLAITKLASSTFACGTNSVVFAMLGESTPPSHRGRLVLFCTSMSFFTQLVISSVTYLILNVLEDFALPIPLLGFTYRPWRLLIQIFGLLNGIMFILLVTLLYESPKFLMTIGKENESLDVLRRIYAINTGEPRKNYKVNKLLLESTLITEKRTFFGSLWKQTAPLFQKDYIKYTFLVCYLCIMTFSVGQPFAIWLPTILNLFFRADGETSDMNFCQFMSSGSGVQNKTGVCDERIDNFSLIGVSVYSTYLVFLSVSSVPLISLFGKRMVFVYTHIICGVAGFLLNHVYGAASLVVFTIMISNVLCMGIATAYAVELFPTYMRAMAVCLTIMVGRGLCFAVVNIIGVTMLPHCAALFYAFPLFVLSGALVGWFLPRDKKETPKTADEPNVET